jgi:uncharacterized protein YqeY
MTLTTEIKTMSKSKDLLKEEKTTLKTLLGEFDRVNDGKPISDEQAVNVIKKFIKNIDETLKVIKDKFIIQNLENEKMLLEHFLPNKANTELLKEVVSKIFQNNQFKNKMQAMKPCIEELTNIGYDVDKKELSELIKNYIDPICKECGGKQFKHYLNCSI